MESPSPKKMTWKRIFRYWYYRLVRTQGSPKSIATGVLLGLFIGFLIPIGLQTVVVLPLAFIFKANKLISFAFTWVSNQFSIFLIYPIQCLIGSYLIARPMSLDSIKASLKVIINQKNAEAFTSLGGELLAAFFAGGFLLGVVSGLIGYFLAYGAVERYRERKRQKMRRKFVSGH